MEAGAPAAECFAIAHAGQRVSTSSPGWTRQRRPQYAVRAAEIYGARPAASPHRDNIVAPPRRPACCDTSQRRFSNRSPRRLTPLPERVGRRLDREALTPPREQRSDFQVRRRFWERLLKRAMRQCHLWSSVYFTILLQEAKRAVFPRASEARVRGTREIRAASTSAARVQARSEYQSKACRGRQRRSSAIFRFAPSAWARVRGSAAGQQPRA
jgi:hypothetical protein